MEQGINPFDSFSRESLVALQIGSAESRAMAHCYLGVEHLVIGLCKIMDKDLETAMRDTGFDRKFFRRYLRQSLGTGQIPVWGTQMLVTPRLTDVVQLAEKIARYWNKREVCPVHLLLAVLLENESIPARALFRLGWDVDPVKQRLFEILGGSTSSSPDNRSGTKTPYLDSIGRDLSALAANGKLREVIGRKAELLAIMKTLARRTKNNVLLVGEPGVGKTCIVEALARKCVKENAPSLLRGKRIVEVTMGSLIAGAQYRGEFEKRVELILKEATNNPETILFLDEIHTLVGSGAAGSGTLDAANIFKPALGRGDIRCIGATTVSEYHRHIEKDAALERRFEIIHVDEPSNEETLEILAGIRSSLESHHGVTITDDALSEAVKFGERYITDRFFPDKAVDILDRACSEVRLQSLTTEGGEFKAGPVTKTVVALVVSQRTGIPVGSLTKEDSEVLLNLDQTLRKRIVGQDEAIMLVTQAVIAGRQFDDRRRPKGVFLFLGPTGVGKTELAKALAEALLGSERYLIRFDMSEYVERHSVMRLIGAPPSYVGYEDEGQLTKAVCRRPYSILLFDEIEKAHPEVVNIFLQLFDDARLTDGKGRTVDFSNTTIIMTSNLGYEAARGAGGNVGFHFGHDHDTTVERRNALVALVQKAVTQHFRPEFVNRIDEMIVFNPLSRSSLEQIIGLLLQEVEQQIAERGLHLEVTGDVRDLLIEKGSSEEYGARELRRSIDRIIRKPLASYLLKEPAHPEATLRTVLGSANEVEFHKMTQVYT